MDMDEQDRLLGNIEKKLTDTEMKLCEGPIYESELHDALKSTHKNKSPGREGLPTEYYERFWEYLKDILVIIFNHAYELISLSESQNHAILRLLFKKDLPEFLKNWRPISLLNTDYKLLSTTLAKRLKNVLPFVIDQDQTCGIPGRRIYDNVFRLRDMCYTHNFEMKTLYL